MSLLNYGFVRNKSGHSQMTSSRAAAEMESSGSQKTGYKSLDKTKMEIKKSVNKSSPPKSKSTTELKCPEIKIDSKLSTSMNYIDSDSQSLSPKMSIDLNLPLQRVKIIMKSCPDVDIVPQEPLHLITKATELFICQLVNDSIVNSTSKKIDYDRLSEYIHCNEYLDFLKETIPKKITWAECQKLLEERESEGQNDLI